MVGDPRNWGFSQVPPDQRSFCWDYELQRHSEMVRGLVLQGRRKLQLQTYDDAVKCAYSKMMEVVGAGPR